MRLNSSSNRWNSYNQDNTEGKTIILNYLKKGINYFNDDIEEKLNEIIEMIDPVTITVM